MKKMLLAAAIAVVTVNFAIAQTRFGIAGGVSFSNMTQKLLGEKMSGLYQAGIVFGVLVDMPMEKNGSFQAGLNFVQKGTHNKKTFFNPDQKTKLTLNYIELPLNVLFKISKTKLTVGGGPAFAIGSGGQSRVETSGVPVEDDVSFGEDEEDDFKAYDVGLNGQIAYNFTTSLFLAVNYTYGINSLFEDKSPDGQLWNRSGSVRLGYFFNCKPKAKK
jgi:hypothetical protein